MSPSTCAPGTASGGNADGDDLADDFENVRGSENDDDLSGDRGANKIWALGGNDILFGDRSDDELYGGAGDDDLAGGDGDDTLEGGDGADKLTGGEDDDTASFAGSAMGVTVRLHSRQIKGGDAEGDTWGDLTTVEYTLLDEDDKPQDFTETVPDIVHLMGSNADDTLSGDSRDNEIEGLGGDDKIYGGPGGGDDVLTGGPGDDMVFGGRGEDTLHGGAGDDMLRGGKDEDEYYGGPGSDMIHARKEDMGAISGASEGDENADDPGDIDTLSYAREEKDVQIDLNNPRFTSIETLIGTLEDDTLIGDNDAPTTVEGGDGADALSGGVGRGNTVSYVNSDRRVSIDLSGEVDTASGGHAQGDELTADTFDNIIGSAYDDILVGDNVADRMNVIRGLAGDDEIVGGDGADTIEGGVGIDELDGDRGRADDQTQELRAGDTLSYAGSSARVIANLATHSYSGGDAEGDEIAVQRGDNAEMYDHDMDMDTEALEVSSFENLTGSAHNDRLTGDHRMNTIMGGDGDDVITGGASMDVLMGQKGDDRLKGEDGGDHLNGGPGADRLDGGEIRGEKDNMKPNDDV